MNLFYFAFSWQKDEAFYLEKLNLQSIIALRHNSHSNSFRASKSLDVKYILKSVIQAGTDA
mgnify:CR=1 FL=1